MLRSLDGSNSATAHKHRVLLREGHYRAQESPFSTVVVSRFCVDKVQAPILALSRDSNKIYVSAS